MLKNKLLVVGAFTGPGAQVADLDLADLVQKDILGLDIADFRSHFFKRIGSRDKPVEQIPQLVLSKVVSNLPPVLDLLMQQIRKIIILDLQIPRRATDPFLPKLINLRQQQVILIKFLQPGQLVLPGKEIILVLDTHCCHHGFVVLDEFYLAHPGVV